MKDFQPLIDAYIKHWDVININEIYKWNAIRHFQETFLNTNVPFGTRIKQCFAKHINLLDSHRYYPLAMLCEVYDDKPEETKDMITTLYDESLPLRERVEEYMSKFDEIVKQMAAEGHSDWQGRTNMNLQSYQDTHSISVYLAMRYPNQHYIYKYGIFRDFSNIVDYKIQTSNKINKYIEYSQLCETVKKVLLTEKPFIAFYNNWLKMNKFEDSNYNLLTQDFIYAVARYLNHDTYTKAVKNKPIKNREQMIEAHEFQSIDTKLPQDFVGVKKIDYAERDKLFRGLGLQGEEWAITYEKERLNKLGITFDVRHSSVLDGDGIGYDILSVEDDGVTPRYIEVKTTTGGVMQPFYYSDNELQFSDQKKENYYVYRIFNFKSAINQADILVIHGSLKTLNGKPTSYKVSVKA